MERRMMNDPEIVKRYLEQGLELNNQIEAHREQLAAVRSQAYQLPSASDFSRASVQSTMETEAPFVRSLERREELENWLQQKIGQLEELKGQIVQVIGRYTFGRDNRILTARYVSVKSWGEIAGELHLCKRQVYRICNEAMKRITLPEDAIWVFGNGRYR